MILMYSGKPYINHLGIPMLGRSMRPPCKESCRQKCRQKITQLQRQRLFDDYYKLADLHRQRQYLGLYMDKTVPKQSSVCKPRRFKVKERTRGNNIQYYLQTDTERLKVCMTMFLATFDISERVACTVVHKTDEKGVVQKDGRGGSRVHRRSKPEDENQKQLENSTEKDERKKKNSACLSPKKMKMISSYSGKPYKNHLGIQMLGRSMRQPCKETCRRKCWEKITEIERQRLFDEFYNLGDLQRQWQYLGRYMDKTVPKQSSMVIERQRTRRNNIQYYLQANKERLKVCMTMFLATFDISKDAAFTVIQKTDDMGMLSTKDKHGTHIQRHLKQDIEKQQQLEDSYCSSGVDDREKYTSTPLPA